MAMNATEKSYIGEIKTRTVCDIHRAIEMFRCSKILLSMTIATPQNLELDNRCDRTKLNVNGKLLKTIERKWKIVEDKCFTTGPIFTI